MPSFDIDKLTLGELKEIDRYIPQVIVDLAYGYAAFLDKFFPESRIEQSIKIQFKMYFLDSTDFMHKTAMISYSRSYSWESYSRELEKFSDLRIDVDLKYGTSGNTQTLDLDIGKPTIVKGAPKHIDGAKTNRIGLLSF
jgi:hypothetical protein